MTRRRDGGPLSPSDLVLWTRQGRRAVRERALFDVAPSPLEESLIEVTYMSGMPQLAGSPGGDLALRGTARVSREGKE